MSVEAPADTSAPAASAPAPAEAAPAAVDTQAAPSPEAKADAPAASAEQPPADAQAQQGDQPKAEGEETKAEGDKPAGAPAEYADFAAPEGVALDADVLASFKGLARELNLPQEVAQSIVDLGSQLAVKAAEQQAAQFEAWKQETVEMLAKDPEIGGAKLEQTRVDMARGRDQFGTPAFTQLLEDFGLSNHPEVVRFLAKVGREVGDDKIVTSHGDTAPASRSLADRMYAKT